MLLVHMMCTSSIHVRLHTILILLFSFSTELFGGETAAHSPTFLVSAFARSVQYIHVWQNLRAVKPYLNSSWVK